MTRIRCIVLSALLCSAAVLAGAPVHAQLQSANDPDLDSRLAQAAAAQALTMLPGVHVPGFQPKLPTLKRSFRPSIDKLITQFLGSREHLLGTGEPIVSPLHSRGTRYKSGTVIYALPKDNLHAGQNTWDLKTLPKLESVPAFLDIYSHGFLYTNNIPHKAVSMPTPEVSGGRLRAQHRDLYSTADGKKSAEQLLSGVGVGIGLPEGFRRAEAHLIQNFGERLYSYRTWPEYLTSYTLYRTVGETRQSVGEQPIAVPVKDMYAHVLLDGDKVLAGMEYFWDSSLTVVGQPKECIQAGSAVLRAREWLLKQHGNNPPLMNVSALTLGFIQKPNDRATLVPAWIFDAWHIQNVKSNVPGVSAANPERIPVPFAVNALTGEVWAL